jgi:hypothetical protein
VACITGAARLMLAMLERCITDLSGLATCPTPPAQGHLRPRG